MAETRIPLTPLQSDRLVTDPRLRRPTAPRSEHFPSRAVRRVSSVIESRHTLATPLPVLTYISTPSLFLWLTVPGLLLLVVRAALRGRPLRTQSIAALNGHLHGSLPRTRSLRFRRPLRASSSDSADGSTPPLLLPLKTAVGRSLYDGLMGTPDAFAAQLAAEIRRLSEPLSPASPPPEDPFNRALYKRIAEVQSTERRQAVRDCLYVGVISGFRGMGAPLWNPRDLSPPSRPIPEQQLRWVTSPEEKAAVVAHLGRVTMTLLGNPENLLTNPITTVLAIDIFQVYAASVSFGYLLRRGVQRMLLSRSAGLSTPLWGEQIRRVMDEFLNEGRLATEAPHQASSEAVDFVQDYLTVLFGNFDQLLRQMKDLASNPTPATAESELSDRLQRAVAAGALPVLRLSPAEFRRLVLEAVAFGAFVRDIEQTIELECSRPLLTFPSDR